MCNCCICCLLRCKQKHTQTTHHQPVEQFSLELQYKNLLIQLEKKFTGIFFFALSLVDLLNNNLAKKSIFKSSESSLLEFFCLFVFLEKTNTFYNMVGFFLILIFFIHVPYHWHQVRDPQNVSINGGPLDSDSGILFFLSIQFNSIRF